MKKLSAFLILTPTLFAARIIGLNSLDVNFSTTSAGVTFSAVNPGNSTSTTQGTVTGPNFLQTTLLAAATDFNGGLSASTQMDLTAGPGTSFNNALAVATSGAVRITNSTASTATIDLAFLGTYSLEALGPSTGLAQFYSALEFYNTATSAWEPLFSTVNSILVGQTLTPCIACAGTTSLQIGANSSVDYRVVASLLGSAVQDDNAAAVPEPSSLVLSALGGLAFAAFRVRRSASKDR